MVIYADVLLAINFAVDYLIVKGACLFCGKKIKNSRAIISAAVGALSSLIVFFAIPEPAQCLELAGGQYDIHIIYQMVLAKDILNDFRIEHLEKFMEIYRVKHSLNIGHTNLK